jgi:methionyl-tRNA synthetase
MSAKKFYLTTPIYYVNARPHIGHAYTTIVADVLARRHRLLGDDTYFLTGTDEHGQKIERSAAAAGVPPQEFADEVSASFRKLWDRMGITYDQFIRTTSPKHGRGAQKLFSTLYERGFIYLASYTGAYCVSDEAFVDAPVGTPCPDCGRLLEEVTEENFFFKLSEFGDRIAALIESNELLISEAHHLCVAGRVGELHHGVGLWLG